MKGTRRRSPSRSCGRTSTLSTARSGAFLHPRYQRATTRAFWESCKRKAAAKQTGIEWLSIKAIDAYPDRVTLPLLGTIPVIAVTVEAKFTYLGTKHTVSDTNYWAKVVPQWKGFWKPEQYRAYKAHRCPPGPRARLCASCAPVPCGF